MPKLVYKKAAVPTFLMCNYQNYNGMNFFGIDCLVSDLLLLLLLFFHILQTKAGPDTLTELDPLDCLFGNGSPLEEIDHPNAPNKPSGTHNRGHRRSHRRRRMRNHEDPSNLEHAAAV